MEDSVRNIFKILIKVPIYIFVAYFIFNIFAFAVTYFKMLGFSYVVMQTAVENNYLPEEEYNTLNTYLQNIADIEVITDGSANIIVIGREDHPEESNVPATERRQYGSTVTIGVQCHYRFIWPLMPNETYNNTTDKVEGLSGQSAFGGFADDATLEARREAYAVNSNNNIIIVYTVPGLKYYPDLG